MLVPVDPDDRSRTDSNHYGTDDHHHDHDCGGDCPARSRTDITAGGSRHR